MSIKDTHDLKHLNTMRYELQERKAVLEGQRCTLQAEINLVTASLRQVDQQIGKLRSKQEPVVSEHALLHYIERRLGLNLDDIRSEILTGRTEQIRKLKDCNIKTSDGMTLVVKNHVVVTVLNQ